MRHEKRYDKHKINDFSYANTFTQNTLTDKEKSEFVDVRLMEGELNSRVTRDQG